MDYLKVISLKEARLYLRIDDDQNEDDSEIELMVKSSLSFLEKKTNIYVCPIEKEYFLNNGCVNVYDFPINSLVQPDTEDSLETRKKSLYTSYVSSDKNLESIKLNVGYENPNNVLPEIIDAAKQIIKCWYYEAEKQINTTLIPESVKEVINVNRRFVL